MTMKKARHILGILAASLFVLGLLFKYQLYTGGSILLVAGSLIFLSGYLPVQLIHQSRNSDHIQQRAYLIVRFITFFLLMTGMVCVIQHWAGGYLFLTIGQVMLVIYLGYYFYLRSKSVLSPSFQWDDLFITILAFACIIYLMNPRPSKDYLKGHMAIIYQYTKQNAGLESANRVIYTSINSLDLEDDPVIKVGIERLRSHSSQFYRTYDSIHREFLSFCASYMSPSAEESIHPLLLTKIFYGTEFFIHRNHGEKLKHALVEYREGVHKLTRDFYLNTSLMPVEVDMSDMQDENGELTSWESYMFENLPTASVLTNLLWIKQRILITEGNMLAALLGRVDLSNEARLIQELASKESEKAMELKENELIQMIQRQELQEMQLQRSQIELRQRNLLAMLALLGILFVLVLFIISTRAYLRKQRDNRKLEDQNTEITAQRDEIEAQRDEIEAQRNLVSLQKEQIEKVHNELTGSIDYATRLQEAILPETELLDNYLSDHMVLFRPKQMVSGDFYWWGEVNGHLVITATDCTGHGVPGAIMSMLGISLLREIVVKEQITDPGEILNRLREEVIRLLFQRGESHEQKDGADLSLISLETGTGNAPKKCRYAGANNPLYLIRNEELVVYRPDTMPVSHYQKMDPFTTREIPLREGDQLYLFSDGYADQFGGEQRKKFKYGAFRQLLLDNSGLPMSDQLQVLEKTITEWQGDQEQIDDMVVIGIRI